MRFKSKLCIKSTFTKSMFILDYNNYEAIIMTSHNWLNLSIWTFYLNFEFLSHNDFLAYNFVTIMIYQSTVFM